ncbi:MAG TPA: ribulose-phosphate 3-epimerase, partial [Deinococcus radiodurans]|nr:ribulose-phosphate 3-epimerase [Deinococcus radiodurans]
GSAVYGADGGAAGVQRLRDALA